MSDPRHDASPSHAPQAAVEQAGEFGLLLRRAREQAGFDLPALAALLKVPRGRIEALEAGRFDELPDGVYARSLASSICRALRIDPKPVLAMLPHAVPRSLDSVAGHKTTRIKSSAAGGRGKFPGSPRASTHVSRRALVLAAVFVLAAAAVVLMPQGASEKFRSALSTWRILPDDAGAAPGAAARGSGADRVVEEVSLPSAGNDTVHPSDARGDAGGPLAPATPSSIATTQAVPGGNAPAGAAPVPAPAPSPVAPLAADAQPVGDAGGLLVVSVTAPTWIKISDAKGAVLVQKTLGAGQVESVRESAGPLAVTIGRVDAATVRVRGEAFDLASRARNNVARFEVK